MRDSLQAALGIFSAFIIYTVLFKISVSLVLMLNTFSVVVIYFAFKKGEVFGAIMGMICGLIQDSFSIGVFGVAGIAKTILGYLAGTLSKNECFSLYPERDYKYCSLDYGVSGLEPAFPFYLYRKYQHRRGNNFFSAIGNGFCRQCPVSLVKKNSSPYCQTK